MSYSASQRRAAVLRGEHALSLLRAHGPAHMPRQRNNLGGAGMVVHVGDEPVGISTLRRLVRLGRVRQTHGANGIWWEAV